MCSRSCRSELLLSCKEVVREVQISKTPVHLLRGDLPQTHRAPRKSSPLEEDPEQ